MLVGNLVWLSCAGLGSVELCCVVWVWGELGWVALCWILSRVGLCCLMLCCVGCLGGRVVVGATALAVLVRKTSQRGCI